MTDKPATWTRCRGCSRRGLRSVLLAGCATLFSAIASLAAFVDTSDAYSLPREQYVPVLGVTMGEKPVGSGSAYCASLVIGPLAISRFS